MAALVMTSHSSATGECSSSCDRDNSVSRRVQEAASEVLRLRLVQSQLKQLEVQLRAASEKLQLLPTESVLQLRSYLEHGLRPGGVGTLGCINGGADPESLCGLMECLCVVCDARVTSKKQEDLLVATRWLLQDPQAFIQQLASLPVAASSQSRRLAPFLLSCDSGWRGQLTEAGQCYETLRHWLSCYYQFSSMGDKLQAINDQLQQQERLLEEITKDTEGGTGSSANRSGVWRQPSSGVRRSSSVQSNSSTGSRRSASPALDRAVAVGLRPSPRPAPPPISRLLSAPVEALGSSSARLQSTRTPVDQRPSCSFHTLTRSEVVSPGRSVPSLQAQQAQSSSSRTALQRALDGKHIGQVEPSPRTVRNGSALARGSARTSGRCSTAAGAPPPNLSPRASASVQHLDLAKTSAAPQRHIVPAVRMRRDTSRDTTLVPCSAAMSSSLLSRLVPFSAERRANDRGGEHHAAQQGLPLDGSPRLSPSMGRSRSLQSINEPAEVPSGTPPGTTPPLSCRGSTGHMPEPYSARVRTTQITPLGSRVSTMPHQSRVTRLSSGSTPSAGSGGTPASGQRRSPVLRTSMPLASRRLLPSDSAATLRHTDGGTGGEGVLSQPLSSSRSTPTLDMRLVSSRPSVRDTPTATPRRPATSARMR